MPELSALSDAELDAFITTRLAALLGIDLDQLPAAPDPMTGSPSRAQALASLRTFVAGPVLDGRRTGGALQAINRWQPDGVAPDAPTAAAAVAQQSAAPLLYPAPATARAPGWAVRP